jgi:hypothetical protein
MSRPRIWRVAVAVLALGGTALVAAPAHAEGPALAVDLTAATHPISPDIYGMNFADEALAAELKLPVRRWGGNATTRYNYLYDTTNRASDWYFENIPGNDADPSQLPNGSETDQFTDQDVRTGTDTVLTVPLIGWAPKERAKACGFSVAKYGPQQQTDPWAPDCGNGVRPDGTLITGNDPHDTSVAIGPDYISGWLAHLTARYGDAAHGGVKFYNLDNEPDIWFSTHRDVHPVGANYEEMRDSTYSVASAVKAADPGAQTLGPVGWGWSSLTLSGYDQQACGSATAPPNCWSAPPDMTAHGGVPFGEWYLRQMAAYQQQHGVRILDYYDNHWYPQGSGVSGSSPGDAATQALRLRETRNLWDPTYTDESWTNQPTYLIPRMKQMVANNYPGTKVAITEYNFGALGSLNGALAQADVLGIFGREGLDLATLWGPPSATDPGAYAFRMYLNYDGAGGHFGDTSVSATSTDQGQLAVYGARRGKDGALTLMVVNKTGSDLTAPVSVTGAMPGRTAQVYQYTGGNLSAIVRGADLTFQPARGTCTATLTTTFPANSITELVVPDATAPSRPGRPSATRVTPSSVTLSWPPARDNVAVTGYQVWGPDKQLATSTSTTVTVTGLAPDTRYTLRVRAVDGAGNVGDASPPLTVQTPRR